MPSETYMTLTPEGYRPRYADTAIEKMFEAFGAVCVEGPKACGKTWASLNHAQSSIMIADNANMFETRRLIKTDQRYALSGAPPHLIDEWQEVTSLWDAVRVEVDRSSDNGRFILTGSSTPKKKGIIHSGAGRIGRMRMRTMSLYESGDSSGSVSLAKLFSGELPFADRREVELEHLIDLTVRGGWPRNIALNAEAAALANKGYLDACLEDAASLDGKARNKAKIKMTIRSLARNESTLASVTKIVNDVREGTVSDNAVVHYLDVLDRLFLTANQLPFDPNFRSSVRVGVAVKRHLTDPALTVAALGLTSEELLKDLRTYGLLFEAMCERDLDIYAQSLGGTLYHYRDDRGREIDAVIELPDGRWGAFEIKLGADQIDEAADKLCRMKEVFAESASTAPVILVVICGMASVDYRRPDGVYVVPITALR